MGSPIAPFRKPIISSASSSPVVAPHRKPLINHPPRPPYPSQKRKRLNGGNDCRGIVKRRSIPPPRVPSPKKPTQPEMYKIAIALEKSRKELHQKKRLNLFLDI